MSTNLKISVSMLFLMEVKKTGKVMEVKKSYQFCWRNTTKIRWKLLLEAVADNSCYFAISVKNSFISDFIVVSPLS